MPGPNMSILTMRSGVNPVAPSLSNTRPGWVSGDIANLAPSSSAVVIFDLGPNWDQFGSVQVAFLFSPLPGGLSAVTAHSSDNATLTIGQLDVQLGSAFSPTFSGASATLTTPQSCVFKPMARYFILQATNADGTNPHTGAAFVQLCAYPY